MTAVTSQPRVSVLIPTGDMPTDELIEHLASCYNKRGKAKDARAPDLYQEVYG